MYTLTLFGETAQNFYKNLKKNFISDRNNNNGLKEHLEIINEAFIKEGFNTVLNVEIPSDEKEIRKAFEMFFNDEITQNDLEDYICPKVTMTSPDEAEANLIRILYS